MVFLAAVFLLTKNKGKAVSFSVVGFNRLSLRHKIKVFLMVDI